MKLLAALALCANCYAVDVYLPVACQHVKQTQSDPYHMRQFNPGLGIGLTWGEWPVKGVVAGVAYIDSYRNVAEIGLVGVRTRLTKFADATLTTGYANTSGYHGPVLIPTIGVGPENYKLEISLISPKAVGFSLRTSF